MEKKIKGYLESRLNHLVDSAIGFEKFLKVTHDGLQQDQIAIKQRKKTDVDAKAEDFKEEILDLNKRFYKMSMVEQNFKNVACAISELRLLAISMKVDLEMTPERKEVYDLFTADDRDIFTIEKGEVVPIDKEMYQSIEDEMVERASSEKSLNENFNYI